MQQIIRSQIIYSDKYYSKFHNFKHCSLQKYKYITQEKNYISDRKHTRREVLPITTGDLLLIAKESIFNNYAS